jgi:hypothetical protein
MSESSKEEEERRGAVYGLGALAFADVLLGAFPTLFILAMSGDSGPPFAQPSFWIFVFVLALFVIAPILALVRAIALELRILLCVAPFLIMGGLLFLISAFNPP